MNDSSLGHDVAHTTGDGMWYQRAGSGRPVVCVHGWCLSGDLWTFEHASLADDYDLVLVDLPGFGRSGDLPGPYTMDRHADSLLTLLAEASVEDAVLVGFAYGAAVAMRAVRRDASRVAGLVAIGIPRAGTLPDDRMLASMARDWPRHARRSAEALAPGAGRSRTVDRLEEIMAATRLDVATQTWEELSRFEPLPLARELRLPTLFVHGSDDTFAPVAAAEECAAAAGGQVRILDGGGHLVVLDRPAELRDVLSEFISDLG